MTKSRYHPNYELPNMGAKIEYALKFNDVNIAVYGKLSEMYPDREGVGLSDGENWDDVLIWAYVDEDYGYGKEMQDE